MQTTSFNAIHAAPGAFMSLTCGHHGSPQGLAVQRGGPADQNLLVGYKPGPAIASAASGEAPDPTGVQPVYLPFFKSSSVVDAEAAFDVDRQADAEGQDTQATGAKINVFPPDSFERQYKYGTDEWRVTTSTESSLNFRVSTPFFPIPDPDDSMSDQDAIRTAVAPVVIAELTLDNHSETVTQSAIFGIGASDEEPGLADIMDAEIPNGAAGFAIRGQTGFLCMMEDDVVGDSILYPVQAFGIGKIHRAEVGIERLGNTGAIVFSVAPKAKKTCRIVFASFLEGIVSTRIRASYFYTRYFSSLVDVLCFGLGDFAGRVAKATQLDALLDDKTHLNDSQRLLVCHATRAYFGSSQLLDVGNSPYYIVNEGAYVMMNTLDLSIDHMFFELEWSPWLVRNVLDNFYKYYSYQDDVVDPKTGEKSLGGLSFAHDQGYSNQFSPQGFSSYERAGYIGCFSYMTQEQLANWIIIAATYVAHSKDITWARNNQSVLLACLASMEQRDNPEPTKRNGIMGFDSSRCRGGQEITTYDSLDPSLKQARNNLYLSVKCWSAYLGLAVCFDLLDNANDQERCLASAKRVAVSVCGMENDGWIPAVFEENSSGNASRILPAIEGCAYPLYWSTHGYPDARHWVEQESASEECRQLLGALERHVKTLTKCQSNRFKDGGIKLSSTSNGSWMSKIAIFQYVAKEMYAIELMGSDAAHWQWQMDESAARQAMCDQISLGKAVGSLYYPRCVTNALWL